LLRGAVIGLLRSTILWLLVVGLLRGTVIGLLRSTILWLLVVGLLRGTVIWLVGSVLWGVERLLWSTVLGWCLLVIAGRWCWVLASFLCGTCPGFIFRLRCHLSFRLL